jgi:hypothetical protein
MNATSSSRDVAEKEKNNNPYYLLVVCSFYRAGLADEK